MRNKVVQLSLFDTYTDVLDKMEDHKSELIELLEKYIDFDAIIPQQFYYSYYCSYGRKRINPLESFIRALFLQKLLGMKQNKQLITLLKFSKELRDFCGFVKLPDEPQITRFKQQFCNYIEMMFYSLVDITEPICKELNEKKSQYLIYDTTGIEPKVKENNPKFLNTKLKEAKNLSKTNPSLDPYKFVYALLPEEAAKAPMARQQYINGHYCYSYKAGIITDGLGIVRHISFFDDDFRTKHPEIVTPKSDNPDKDKEVGDNVSLKPVLSDFFGIHPDAKYTTFLGDSAFDSYDTYSMLKDDFHFSRACIPLNHRNSKSSDTHYNQFGNPVCPLDGTQFTCLGKSGGKNRSLRIKWVCHKSTPQGNKRICTCETPCTESSYGKCTYTYPDKNFRDCPGIPRNTEHWDNLYKHRVLVERTINTFKDAFGLDDLRSVNTSTIKSDLFLAGCIQLVGVILAIAIHKTKLYKSVRKLVSSIA